MSGQKIIDGLRDAVAGNFARVTIEGQTWERVDKTPPHPAQASGGAKDVDPDELAMVIVLAYDKDRRISPEHLIHQLARRGMRIAPASPSPPEPSDAAVEALKKALEPFARTGTSQAILAATEW